MARQYSRVFFTLKKDRTGYDFKGREPSGRCTIEIKDGIGKLSIYIQDARPEVIYKAYLVHSRIVDSEGVLVGNLNVDSKGKSETKFEFDPENVGGSGKRIEQYNVLAVIVPSKSELITPLVGFKDEPTHWKNNFKPFNVKSEEITTEIKLKLEAPASPHASIESELSAAPLNLHDSEVELKAIEPEIAEPDDTNINEISNHSKINIQKVVMESKNEFAKERDFFNDDSIIADDLFTKQAESKEIIEEIKSAVLPVVDENDEVLEILDKEIQMKEMELEKCGNDGKNDESIYEEKADLHETFIKMAKKFGQELKELEQASFMAMEPQTQQETKNSHDKHTQTIKAENLPEMSKLDKLFLTNIKMRPFQRQNIDVNWVRISIKELSCLPNVYWKYMNHPFIFSAYNKYKHLILGEYGENGQKKYFLGVPEVYESNYKQRAVRMGFLQFKCCEDIRATTGEYGYWIMSIVVH